MGKNTNAIFRAIRKHDNGTVRTLLLQDPSLVNACASAPPKKDDGQSPLQVALKTGNFEIASLLIDMGANVRFMEESQVNAWRIPVLHDALRAAVFTARKTGRFDDGTFDQALAIVRRLLAMGVDPNAVDSHGNPALLRALSDARQRLVDTDETLRRDLRAVVQVLITAGADTDASNPSGFSVMLLVREPALASLIR